MAELIMFHGRECPHCKAMMPLVDRLEQETGVRFEKREVWHDEANADLMRSHRAVIAPQCGGQLKVPTFFDPAKGEAVCGEMPYEKLKDWALER